MRSFTHRYDIGRAVNVSTMSTGALHRPTALCQFQSRARPASLKLIKAMARRPRRLHVRGHQRYSPEIARTKKIVLAAPVTVLARGRLSPEAPSQRCHSFMLRKKARVRGAFDSLTAPV